MILQCKTFTKTYNDDHNAPACKFNEWCKKYHYEVTDVQSHADQHGEVISIVVFYEVDEDEMSAVY